MNIMHIRKRMLRINLQSLLADLNLELQLSLCADSPSAQAIVSCKSSRHTNEDAMAARTCCSKTLTSCESGIRIKSCRHVDESPWKVKN